MRFLKQLLRNLSKIVDEAYGCIPLERIVNAEDVDITLMKNWKVLKLVMELPARLVVPFNLDYDIYLVEKVVENIGGFNSSWSLLLAPKDQINP